MHAMNSLGISPVNKVPVEVQAANALRDAIVNGQVPPGSRITENQLATEMGLSRASIRTALHQLAKEGLTSLIPYTGWTVVSLGANDVWELYTLRSSMERLAARLLVESGDAQKIAAFGAAFLALTQACATGNSTEIAEADFGLHKTLIVLSGHARLGLQYEDIERQIRMCIGSSDALIESPAAILEQHRPLAEAVLSGRADLAAHHAESHNLIEGAKLRDHLHEREQAREVESALRPSRGMIRLKNRNHRPSASAGEGRVEMEQE